MKRYFPDHDQCCRSSVDDARSRRLCGMSFDHGDLLQCLASIDEVVEWQVVVRKKNGEAPRSDEIVLSVALRDGVDVAEIKGLITARLITETGISPILLEVILP